MHSLSYPALPLSPVLLKFIFLIFSPLQKMKIPLFLLLLLSFLASGCEFEVEYDYETVSPTDCSSCPPFTSLFYSHCKFYSRSLRSRLGFRSCPKFSKFRWSCRSKPGLHFCSWKFFDRSAGLGDTSV